MMKRVLIAVGLMAVCVFAATGQVQPTVKGSSSAASDSSVSKGGRELVSSGTVVNAELMNSIDVRKSKVGDQVLLKTTKAIKQNGDTVVAKGTTLVGRITEIQQRTKENTESRVGMLIERIQGKELDAPISASILSMTGARTTAATNETFADSGLTSSSSTNIQRSGSSGNSSGGLLGGVGNTVGGAVNTTTQTTGNVVGGATRTVGSAIGGAQHTVGNSVGTVGGTVNGIQISQAMGGSASGSTNFSAQKKDVRIEKGTTFNIQFNSSVSN